ncbi:MAG: hypothetical protein QOF85_2535 [Solirubrobacterales bacterium]|jgi:hypothetical protein|nr:hypothetical protein [Solirubrobacterales bacterium]
MNDPSPLSVNEPWAGVLTTLAESESPLGADRLRESDWRNRSQLPVTHTTSAGQLAWFQV